MPDLLTHYALSYLIASRVARPRYALFIALAGLLPDVDALFRIHRSITHSTILVLVVGASIALILHHLNDSYIKYVALAVALYGLHIVLDMFTAPTPILWPLSSQAYMVDIELSGKITRDMISISPSITVSSTPADFAPKTTLEGPLITTMGLIIAIGVLITVLVEYLYSRRQSNP